MATKLPLHTCLWVDKHMALVLGVFAIKCYSSESMYMKCYLSRRVIPIASSCDACRLTPG